MSDPETSCEIVVPVWNQWPLTEACLLSVKEKTRLPYRLILIDNGSDEETRSGLARIAEDPSWKATLIRNEENRGYVRAVNQGLAVSNAPFVCLLNNDVLVTAGWLERMIEFARRRRDAGLVTCLQNDDPGRKVPADLETFARTRVEAPGAYEELDHTTGTCLLIKRELIEAVGLLDEAFGLGQWEDNDYSRRAQQAGFRSYRLRDTYVWHHIGSSFQTIPLWREGEHRNRERFYAKWGRPLRIIYPISEGIDLRRARFHQILQTVHALARKGCEVDFIIGKNALDAAREALPHYGLVRHQNLRIHPVRMLRPEERSRIRFSWNGVFHVAAGLKIRTLLRDREYGAIYLRHLGLADFLLRWKKFLKVPVVFEAHEVFHLTTDREDKAQAIEAEEKRVYGRVDGVVAISRGLAEHLQELYSIRAPLEVIPDGVNPDLFAKERGEIQEGKIVYVGQLYPWKGAGVAIEAMRYLPGRKLHLVGGAERQIEELRRMARELRLEERVVFHGQVSPLEVRDQLADAQVAVLPLSRQTIAARYTSPLKLFEYMAAGVPIVASDLPSVREILTNGVNALLVEPENPKALAQGIERMVLGGTAERLAGAASMDARGFTWEKRAERIIQFLRTLERSPW